MAVKGPTASVPGLGPALGSLVTAWKLVGHGSLSASFSVSHLLHQAVGFVSLGRMRTKHILAVSAAGHAEIQAFHLA